MQKKTSSQNKRTAEPIKTIGELERIRSILKENPRDLLLFDLAVETGLGMKKILRMKVKDMARIREGERISLASDHGKVSYAFMTDLLYETFNRYMDEVRPNLEDFLIKSKKGQRPLNLSTVSNMINGWFKAADIKNCHGAISLRKTWEFNNKEKSQGQSSTETKSPSKAAFIFQPLEATTVQHRIFKELFKAIVSRKIPPGTRLTADEISRAFKVSQAPVRVAMNWLEARGFIISQRKRGSIVRELTTDELHELIEVRLILELAAAKLACKARTEETLNQLEAIIEHYKNAYTFEESDKLNRQFHRTLYRDVNMPLLTTIIMDLYNRFSPYAALAFADLSHEPDPHIRKEGPGYYHTKILEGMRHRDIDQVVKYLDMKLRRGMLLTEEVMKQSERIDSIDQ